MKIPAKIQIIIAAVLILLVAVVFAFLAILPNFGELDELELQKADQQMRITTAQTLLSRRLEMKMRAAENQAELIDLATRIPESPQLPSLIIELQDSANQAELDFASLTPGAASDAAGVVEIPISVNLRGEWEQVIHYLQIIQGLKREFRISTLSISASELTEEELEEDETISKVVVSFDVRTYMINPVAPAAPEPEPEPAAETS